MDQTRGKHYNNSNSSASWTSGHHTKISTEHRLPAIGHIRSIERARKHPPPDRTEAHISALLVETMGYLQLLVADLMGGGDLVAACTHWAQVLRDLAAALEQAIGLNSGESAHAESTAAIAGLARTTRVTEPRALGAVLTLREREIMKRVEKGDSYLQIAKRLDISVQTVYKHVGNARRKLREHNPRTIR